MSGETWDRRCVACGAPRERADGACVECGAPAPTTVDAEIPCRRCGYSLKGLATTGACPECGAPVRASLVGDFLAASSREHVARLVRGAMLVEVGLYLGVLFACVGSPLTVALLAPASGATGWLVGGVGLGLGLLGLAGWWLVSARDPGRTQGAGGEGARITLRVSALACAAGNLAFYGGMIGGALDPMAGLSRSLVRGGGLMLGASWAVHFFAAVTYVRVLAARVPSAGLLGTARTTMVIPIWTFGLGIPLLIVTALLGWLTPPAGLIAILVVAGMGVAVLVWFIWYCAMISGLRDRLETVRALMPQVAED